LRLLREAQKLHDCAVVWYEMGYVHELRGKPAEALNSYRHCLKLDRAQRNARAAVVRLESLQQSADEAPQEASAPVQAPPEAAPSASQPILDGTQDVEMKCKCCGETWIYSRQQQAAHIKDFGAANRRRCNTCIKNKPAPQPSRHNEIEGRVSVLGPAESPSWGFITVEGMPDFYFDVDHCVGRRMPNANQEVVFVARRYGDKRRASAAEVRPKP